MNHKTKDRADFWMILAVMACLAGSIPRGIGQPIPSVTAPDEDCWFAGFPSAVECVISGVNTGTDLALRLLPLLDRGARSW